MRLDEALARLERTHEPVLSSADVVGLLGISRDHASHVLARLSESGHLVRLKRGLWTFADSADVLALAPHLVAPLPSYVSLQSALYYHGMISQIPAVAYSVTLARTNAWRTAVGAFSFHHVSPAFFFGFDRSGGTCIATPEKALVDALYFGQARSRLFAALPEIELGDGFDREEARTIANRIGHTIRRTRVARQLESLLSAAR